MEERINTYAKILLLLDGPRMKLMATFQFISRAQEEDQPKGILLHVFAVDINNSTTVFLQANKESIFVTSLWDQGLGVLADANEDKEITTIQRLSRHFPKASDILWYMLGFFPKIFQHSSLHPKTTLNSPLCVVPSMLSHWPSTSRISSLEENQEISLVDSPIKNCLCIHSDDIVACQMESSLISPTSFGKSPFNSDTTKHEHSFEEMQQSLEISLMPIISMDKQAQLKDDAKPITDSHIKLTQKQHPTKKRLCRHVLGRNHKLVPAPAPDLPISQQAPLFGSPLQDVCKNDKLPKPILDMLFIIDQKGPATKAIFSKCATFKDRLALKEKLNSRECVAWENACPIVVATVLKDLLQNIPGSILTVNFYEKFIGVLDEGNEEAKIAMSKRLLAQLPKPNVHLLQSLFRCLHKISQKSPLKEMTSSNLAWCITPSLLWPPVASILDIATEWEKKVALVQFLLDHCSEIFGDSITSTIRDHPKHRDHYQKVSAISGNMESSGNAEGLPPASDPHQKPTQKRHSVKKWLSEHIRGRKHSKVAPETSTPTYQQAKIFGSILQDVCKDDKLPKPILDMLFIIDRKGPATKAIFSKCANFKDCLALKEKLNAGERVDRENACPIVVATVFKDLLQNIPGSVFTANLYEKFLGVLDERNDKTKIAMIQRLLAQLPKPNVHLLQSLFCCLHKISQKSPSKEMTSSNLAWCITPSLLWPPVANILDIATEWEKKVALVQFLLDHCFKIFGSSLTSTIRKQTKYRKHYLEVSAISGNMQSSGNDGNEIPLIELSLQTVPYSSDPQLKPAQKQHSIKKWLTPRVLGRNQNRVAPEPARPTAHQAQLFGSLLQDVCENGKLPKSILDMLYFIDLKGSITEGIFKKCVNGQAYRTLREKLNSGEAVDWTTESPYVVATVLKDFLQSIPGSLFTTELYEKFIGAMDEGNKKARISIILRLLDQLPKMNFHLLECLFTCLYKIAHSPLNNMTSSDLSLYMTPSLLWIPISRNSERGMEWQRKVTLIQFLIDNCKNIFGHRLTSCMGGHTKYEDTFQELLEKMELSVDSELMEVPYID
ncbi:uncharacterized protein [Oryctolagus cuniculus]|uniref:uncharacterized protein isoform X1 n=1 Tax=Oryctolagus cuniculus TaxID=9986 RepID=UPI00387973E0